MRNTSALMTDIETMSTEPNSAIVSIGACIFDPAGSDTVETLTDRFYCSVSLESCIDIGLHMSPSTISWWLRQSREAQLALFTEPHRPIRAALTEFRMWAQGIKPAITTLWANDPDFDYVILKQAFRAANQMWPFEYYMHRSCRTALDWGWPLGDPPNFRAGTTHHKADDDAAAQAVMVQAAYRNAVLQR
jgi:truncated hemoglobin YjbI